MEMSTMAHQRSRWTGVFLPLLLCAAAAGQESTEPKKPLSGKVINILGGDSDTTRPGAPTYFVDKSSVPVLTNQPERYRNNPAYTEKSMRFDKIVVPGRFRTYDSTAQYTKSDYSYLVRRYARKYGLRESLIYAVIKAESDGDPNAVSRAGARGLMQLMPGTAAEMQVTSIFDPAQNIAGGTQYLAGLLKAFSNNLTLALAAYNAGPATVRKYGGVPPFPETQDYVNKVVRFTNEIEAGTLSTSFAQGRKLAAARSFARKASPILVTFKSGLTQPADKVTREDGYYLLEFRGRIYRIAERLVAKVV
jgi:hypothetical protein